MDNSQQIVSGSSVDEDLVILPIKLMTGSTVFSVGTSKNGPLEIEVQDD